MPNLNLIYPNNQIILQNNVSLNKIKNSVNNTNKGMIYLGQTQNFNENEVPSLFTETQMINSNTQKKEYNPNIVLKQNEIRTDINLKKHKISDKTDNQNKLIKYKIKDEVATRTSIISTKVIKKTELSICKVTVHIKNQTRHGTGFFMELSESFKYLITS